MDIIYKTNSLFDSVCDILVNPVNTVGVMGAGLAAAFKKLYKDTDMFSVYSAYCNTKILQTGERPLIWWSSEDNLKSVMFFPTKGHYKHSSNLAQIAESLSKLQRQHLSLKEIEKYSPLSIAFPKLGCGYGGLDWEYVKPVMEEMLRSTVFERIEIYE